MATLFDALGLDTPIAGFNGGLFVRRDLSIVEQKTVEPDLRLEFDRPGFPGHVRGARLGDQPVIAAIDPGIEAVLANEREGLAGNGRGGFRRQTRQCRQDRRRQ
jgi:hypothetical protein